MNKVYVSPYDQGYEDGESSATADLNFFLYDRLSLPDPKDDESEFDTIRGLVERISTLKEDVLSWQRVHRTEYEKREALDSRIAALEEAQRWIPVSEQPIPEGEDVLMCHWYEAQKQMCWIASGSVENGVYFCDVMDDDFEPVLFRTVTHWLPLPAPPEAI